jgi:hypothetical protein
MHKIYDKLNENAYISFNAEPKKLVNEKGGGGRKLIFQYGLLHRHRTHNTYLKNVINVVKSP